ncbi:MAG TPA: hypothetical protein VIJ50_07495 [Solirubrobacteraceae bacterium]
MILIIGLGASVYALRAREGNPQFVSQQQGLEPVAPGALQRLILTTSDPRPGYAGRARGTRCSTMSHSALGNPWSCVVHYPHGPDVRYRVTVHGDRSIHGIGRSGIGASGGVLTVRGCCVAAGP